MKINPQVNQNILQFLINKTKENRIFGGLKMNQLEVLYKRNKLFVILSWFSTLLSLLSVLSGKLPASLAAIILLPMLALDITITFLHIKKYLVAQTMYIVTIWSGILNLITFQYTPSIIIFIVMTTLFLIIQSRFSSGLRRDLAGLNEKSLTSNKRIQTILNEVKKALHSLNSFNISLRQDVEVTNSISDEITYAFSEIAASMDSLSQNIAASTDLMHANSNSVDNLSKVSNNMKQSTHQTVEFNQQGIVQIDILGN